MTNEQLSEAEVLLPQRTSTRPTMVTVLGWIWVAIGSFLTLGSTFAAVFTYLLDGPWSATPQGGVEHGPFSFPLINWAFRHFRLLVIGQWVLALAILIAAVAFLRLRRWARVFLELTCWAGLTYMVVFAIGWAYEWSEMSRGIGPDVEGPSAAVMTAFGVGAVGMSALMWGVPLGFMIRFLRHRTVRAALGERPGG